MIGREVPGFLVGCPCGVVPGRDLLGKRLPPGCFVPKPDVGSCVVTLKMKESFPLSEEEEQFLDAISRSVFSEKENPGQRPVDVIPDKGARVDLERQASIPSQRPEDLGAAALLLLPRLSGRYGSAA